MDTEYGITPDMLDKDNHQWPYFADDEIDAVVNVLRSGKVNYWTGQEIRLFEKEFADSIGCDHGVALANGTVALELAIYALGFEPGDEVIVTPRTFIASASAIIIHDLIPVFADVDRNSGNITAETIESVITPKTRAIIAVHLAGWPCDMDPILDIARKYNLKVIEDCAQCHGATYKGRPCGSLGDVAAWSFCQDKIMTTGGEGGMLTTNNNDIWASAWAFKDHGKNYSSLDKLDNPASYRWLHDTFGSNYRMTEMQAAIGRIQLSKLSQWVAVRRQNAAILENQLSDVPGLRIPVPDLDIGHSYYRFYAYIIPELLKPGCSRDQLLNECHRMGIPCFSGSCSEIYLENAFNNTGLQPVDRLPVAKELGETTLAFLVHPMLTEDYMHAYARMLHDVFMGK
ncbi:MAG: DegT/DnrJ/EryC1/StrS family aminotransferase [Armatimonadota bacterium]